MSVCVHTSAKNRVRGKWRNEQSKRSAQSTRTHRRDESVAHATDRNDRQIVAPDCEVAQWLQVMRQIKTIVLLAVASIVVVAALCAFVCVWCARPGPIGQCIATNQTEETL